jgi:hypothetical protein
MGVCDRQNGFIWRCRRLLFHLIDNFVNFMISRLGFGKRKIMKLTKNGLAGSKLREIV